jgi:IS5 family transposase
MKSDGRLARCSLKGRIGDALFAVLCACGHNIRKILAHLRALWTFVIPFILRIIADNDRRLRMPSAA